MEQYILKSALVAKIDKLYNEEIDTYTRNILDRLKYNINDLEVKEVDLDREMQAFALLYLEPLKISDSNIGISITMSQLYSCAKHFFELGLKVQKGE